MFRCIGPRRRCCASGDFLILIFPRPPTPPVSFAWRSSRFFPKTAKHPPRPPRYLISSVLSWRPCGGLRIFSPRPPRYCDGAVWRSSLKSSPGMNHSHPSANANFSQGCQTPPVTRTWHPSAKNAKDAKHPPRMPR